MLEEQITSLIEQGYTRQQAEQILMEEHNSLVIDHYYSN
jgi:hypothetical protein